MYLCSVTSCRSSYGLTWQLLTPQQSQTHHHSPSPHIPPAILHFRAPQSSLAHQQSQTTHHPLAEQTNHQLPKVTMVRSTCIYTRAFTVEISYHINHSQNYRNRSIGGMRSTAYDGHTFSHSSSCTGTQDTPASHHLHHHKHKTFWLDKTFLEHPYLLAP